MKTTTFFRTRYLKAILIVFLLLSKTSSYCQTSNINAYAVFDDSIRAAGQLYGDIYLNKIDTTNILQFEVNVSSSETDTVYLVLRTT